jgi:hypothetical protein
MYEIDELDELRMIRDLLQSSVGTPIPKIACDEHTIYLACYKAVYLQLKILFIEMEKHGSLNTGMNTCKKELKYCSKIYKRLRYSYYLCNMD